MNQNPNLKTSLSQADRILSWLEKGNSLTAVQAFSKFDCSRLAARIRDLRGQGHLIISERWKLANGKTVSRYRIGEEVSNG